MIRYGGFSAKIIEAGGAAPVGDRASAGKSTRGSGQAAVRSIPWIM
jgi:hypothetical protein